MISAGALDLMSTVGDMPAKPQRDHGLTDKQKEHLRTLLQPIVDERFDGNATQAAKAMRIPQPQLAQILHGEKSPRSAGVAVLVRIRAFTGITLDDLLGLPPLRHSVLPLTGPAPADPELRGWLRDEIRAAAREITTEPPQKGNHHVLSPLRPRRRP